MNGDFVKILKQYLQKFPEEKERQAKLSKFLSSYDGKSLVDWNNFDGHMVAGGFVYAREEKKILVLYHKQLKMYLYPGGHVEESDSNILETAKREIMEETGLTCCQHIKIMNDELIPMDIDAHLITFNGVLNLPQHYHFDFRYLFMIDRIKDITIDEDELLNYRWVDFDELRNDSNFGEVVVKIEALLSVNNL